MCISPVACYRSKTVNPSGKRSLVHDIRKALDDTVVYRPCGSCIECRIQDASDKTVRMVHESKSHNANCFVTLTYSDKYLPEDGSLNHRHFQLFMKRLRKISPFKFKFYMCGEYGKSWIVPIIMRCCLDAILMIAFFTRPIRTAIRLIRVSCLMRRGSLVFVL